MEETEEEVKETGTSEDGEERTGVAEKAPVEEEVDGSTTNEEVEEVDFHSFTISRPRRTRSDSLGSEFKRLLQKNFPLIGSPGILVNVRSHKRRIMLRSPL